MRRAIASWFPATVEVVDAESYDTLAAEVATLRARLAEASQPPVRPEDDCAECDGTLDGCPSCASLRERAAHQPSAARCNRCHGTGFIFEAGRPASYSEPCPDCTADSGPDQPTECECPVEGHNANCPNDRLIKASNGSQPDAAHVHTDECWEPGSGCDLGRNAMFVRVASEEDNAAIDKAVGHSRGILPESIENLRRIGERGLRLAQEKQSDLIDIFQHMLDEIGRLRSKQ